MPFFRRGPQPPTQAISTKLKKPVHFHVHWFILSVTTGSLYLSYMDYSYSSAISIAKTYILKKYSYMHPSEFLNLWIFNVYLVTCSLLFKTYFIFKKKIFFSFRKLRTCSYFVFNSFLHQSLSRNKTRNTGKWTTTKKWRPGFTGKRLYSWWLLCNDINDWAVYH